jgi:hypothetical protein
MNLPTREDIVRELNIGSLPLENQNEIIGDLGHFILTEVVLATVDKLPTDVQGAFSAFIEEGKGPEAEALASEHIPDFPTFVAQESAKALTKIKETYAAQAS